MGGEPSRDRGGAGPLLTVLGNAADFTDKAPGSGPDWEHTLLLREPGVARLALDTLASPPGSRWPGRRVADVPQLWRLAGRLRGSRAVLAQSEQSGYQAMLAQAAALRRRPLLIIVHGHWWWTRRNRAYAALAKRLPWVRFLCLSESLRALVVREYGIDPSRVHATGYGVDAAFFTPDPGGELPGRPLVVSAGAASRDYRTLVEAAGPLDAGLHIAADSNWYPEQPNITPGELPRNVHVASSGGYGQLRALYARASFVVVPMLDVHHACGYAVIAEAMAMGKAVIATRTGCPGDLIAEGVSGLYVPPGDVAALREAMQRLLSDPALAGRMGAEGRRLVEERFNLPAYVSRLKAFALPN